MSAQYGACAHAYQTGEITDERDRIRRSSEIARDVATDIVLRIPMRISAVLSKPIRHGADREYGEEAAYIPQPNDQVALDMGGFIRDEIDETALLLLETLETLYQCPDGGA